MMDLSDYMTFLEFLPTYADGASSLAFTSPELDDEAFAALGLAKPKDCKASPVFYHYQIGLPRHRRMTFVRQTPALRTWVLSAQIYQRYFWRAVIPNAWGVRFAHWVSPRGILELFKDRDKPESGRREALRHWVSNHSRVKRDGTAAEVRAHLRGATSFIWRGSKVEIVPSDLDRETEIERKAC
jgi:hypothetical protein